MAFIRGFVICSWLWWLVNFWFCWDISEFRICLYFSSYPIQFCPVVCGCRIHQLLLCRDVRPPTNEWPGYDGEFQMLLELWRLWSTPSLPSLSSPFWSGMVAPNRALSIGLIELICVLILNWIVWNRTDFDSETVLTLKWIIWIRTVWINWIAWNRDIFDN